MTPYQRLVLIMLLCARPALWFTVAQLVFGDGGWEWWPEVFAVLGAVKSIFDYRQLRQWERKPK